MASDPDPDDHALDKALSALAAREDSAAVVEAYRELFNEAIDEADPFDRIEHHAEPRAIKLIAAHIERTEARNSIDRNTISALNTLSRGR